VPFVFDVTEAIKPGSSNRLAIRVLFPDTQPIDGFIGSGRHDSPPSLLNGLQVWNPPIEAASERATNLNAMKKSFNRAWCFFCSLRQRNPALQAKSNRSFLRVADSSIAAVPYILHPQVQPESFGELGRSRYAAIF